MVTLTKETESHSRTQPSPLTSGDQGVWVDRDLGFPDGTVGKSVPANADSRDSRDPRVRKIPWSRKWQPTPESLRGKSHGKRSLVGYSLQGCKELDMTEHTHTHIHTSKDRRS